ncbi:MAG: Fic family protein [Deltaproteobacteria bacterium]|nr:Fic family protein [Deltaproteobacteria bacterium]
MRSPDDLLPPFLFSGGTQAERRYVARLKREGRIRGLGPRLFTSLPADKVDQAVKNAWSTIVVGLFPGVQVSHRTALEYVPDPDGVVFLTASTNRRATYAGLHLEFIRGPAPLDDDPEFVSSLRASSLPRALLENLSRDARVKHPRTLPIEAVERRLEQLLVDGGEDELNRIRDRARAIANELGWRAELERLDQLIGGLLGTRSASNLTGAAARARAAGEPYDPECLNRLQLLVGELKARALAPEPDVAGTRAHQRNKAFFEAYFSNDIEGTTFEIEEAESIVFDKQIPRERPADAHDITGTFAIVSDPVEMRRVPASAEELVALLRARHAAILGARTELAPGQFKTRPNRAGDTHFVRPEYVVGTLAQGHAIYIHLPPGLQRAIFMMFLIADTHPFDDGNGRLARVMMNAEMVAADTSTIIIPTVFRDDYLNALRALTRRHRATPLVDALAKAARFSRLDFSDYPRVLADLQRRNWFAEPDDARIDDSAR